jgi:HlyD family secretion protein
MHQILQKIKSIALWILRYALGHKIISSVILIVLIVAGYYGYKSLTTETAETRYILTSVAKGMINTSVSGTGQVAPKEEKNIKAKASGEITYLNSNVKVGATIARGTSIATIDTTEAKKTIQEAEESLESAQIALAKLIGADESNPRNKQGAQKDLAKSYEDGYNSVSSVFLDLPAIMKGLDDILYGNTFNNYQDNIYYYTYATYTYNENILQYKADVNTSYETARDAYNKNFENYKKSNRYSDTATIDAIITETYETTKSIAQSVKDTINFIQFYEDTLTYYGMEINSTADTHLSSLSSYLSESNSSISSLFSATSTIEDDKEALEDTDSDIRTAKLTVTQKERTLQEAKNALNNYYIYATLGGIVSEINISQGDDVSSGSTAVTIITESKIAEITLSEVDVAKVKVGNKATLTFDAIEDLTITGEVTEVDSAGVASSGVVSYGIEISFDTNEDNVKSGMSVSATIITNSKNDVLTVPSTSVKSNDDGTYYVQILSKDYDLTNKTNSIKGVTSATSPATKAVEIGLSDDTNTEITSGLSEGDQIVVRVSSGSASSTSSSSSSKSSGNILNTGGGGGMPAGGPPGM